jgi:arginase family enzyme
LEKVLNDLDATQIYVSFDIGSINSAWSLGVSEPSVVGGFTAKEVQQLALALGTNKSVK